MHVESMPIRGLCVLAQTPSDLHVTQSGGNDDQCWQRQEYTFLPDMMDEASMRTHLYRQFVRYSLPGSQCRLSRIVSQ